MEEFQQGETSVRYMMFIKHPGDYDVKNVPPALFGAMGQFVEEEINKGVFVDGAGLQPLSKATRVSLASGQIKVMDGPSARPRRSSAATRCASAKATRKRSISPGGSWSFTGFTGPSSVAKRRSVRSRTPVASHRRFPARPIS
jgi:hypothetical protein